MTIQLNVITPLSARLCKRQSIRWRFHDGAHALDNFRAEPVHFLIIRAHTLQHDLLVDVDHVRMTDLLAIHDVRHLHARLQFMGLRLHGKNADLAGLKIGGNRLRQVGQRSGRDVFQHPGLVAASNLLQFVYDRRSDLQACLVGDDGHSLRWLHAQAYAHRIARTRRQLRAGTDPGDYERGRFGVPAAALCAPAGNRTMASFQGPRVYTYDRMGGLSWTVPYLAGVAALGLQIDPSLKPGEIVRLWKETASKTKAGPVINPGAFVEAVKKRPVTNQ